MMKTIIIAEAGVNHNGDIELAKELIDAAAQANADYVKFQTFKAESLVTKTAKRAAYQDQNTGDTDSQFEMLKKLELSIEDHHTLIAYARERGIEFLSTAFDLESLEFLHSLHLKLAKVPSGEITNLPYLRRIAQLYPKVILSTGMATIKEISEACDVLYANGTLKDNLIILHCTTEYPTPMKEVNLKAMLHIQREFGVDVGYSDHTLGIEVPIAAVALGAKVIEKHFTLNRNFIGPDHIASLEPSELKAMVDSIRNIELAISGSGIKEPTESEKKNKDIARKSIVAAKDIKIGDIFTEENLTIKRPGNGISSMKWDQIIGLASIKDYKADELINL